jgi:uncharacterized Fe-S center protein
MKMAVSRVYFTAVGKNEPLESVAKKVKLVYEKAGLSACIKKDALVGIKLHFGEKGNKGHLRPALVSSVVEAIKAQGGKPFLTDTNTLYAGERSNAVDHLHQAEAHGFSMREVGAPVIISDGLIGRNEIRVKIPGVHFSHLPISAEVVSANALIAMAHVTGHLATGLGGAIKNVGMGCATRKGKMVQHSDMKPAVKPKVCTRCGECVQWCPVQAITLEATAALIDSGVCIGCGECLAVCRYGAIEYNWKTSSRMLQEKMAEYAYGAIIMKKEKVGFMNFLLYITKDCDCMGDTGKPVCEDIGILASRDIVAVDAASLDLIGERAGKTLRALAYPKIDETIQLRHGEHIGMGTMKYELEEV